MKMESAERLPGLDRRGLRKRASARRRKRHRHLLLTQHLPNFGTESEIGIETMSGERSSRGKGPARPNFSWEEFELAQRPTKSLLTPGTRITTTTRARGGVGAVAFRLGDAMTAEEVGGGIGSVLLRVLTCVWNWICS